MKKHGDTNDNWLYNIDDSDDADWWKPKYDSKRKFYENYVEKHWNALPYEFFEGMCDDDEFEDDFVEPDYNRELGKKDCYYCETYGESAGEGYYYHIVDHTDRDWRKIKKEGHKRWDKLGEDLQTRANGYELFSIAYIEALTKGYNPPMDKLLSDPQTALKKGFIKPSQFPKNRKEHEESEHDFNKVWRRLKPNEKSIWLQFDNRLYVTVNRNNLSEHEEDKILRSKGRRDAAKTFYKCVYFDALSKKIPFPKTPKEALEQDCLEFLLYPYKNGKYPPHIKELIEWIKEYGG